MKRKVNIVGGSTCTISLPSPWVKKFGIKKGDELELSQQGNTLVIDTDCTRLSERIDLDIKYLDPRMAAKVIVIAFQKGYDIIKLNYKSEEVLYAVQDRIGELMGFSIMDQGKGWCVIQNISSKLEIDFETIVRKAFFIVIDMMKSTLDYYKSGDKEALKHLTLQDKEVNKFCYYCQRVINKDYHYQHLEGYALYHLIRVLESIGDEVKGLMYLLSEEEEYNKSAGDLIAETIKLLEHSHKIFFNPKEEALAEFFKQRSKLKENIFSKGKSMNKREMEIAFYLRTIGDLCYHFASLKSDVACKKPEISPQHPSPATQ